MTGLLRQGLSALTVVLCLAGTAQAAGTADFVGKFNYDGTTAQKAAIKAEVARAAQEFNPITRLIARGRLEHAASVPQNLIFTATGPDLGVQKDSLPNRSTRLDGTPISFTHDGKATTLSRRLSGDAIVETAETDEGVRTMTFQLSGSKQEMTVSTVVAAKSLKQPLRYTVTYRRSH